MKDIKEAHARELTDKDAIILRLTMENAQLKLALPEQNASGTGMEDLATMMQRLAVAMESARGQNEMSGDEDEEDEDAALAVRPSKKRKRAKPKENQKKNELLE